MTSQDDITPDVEDVEGHRTHQRPLLPDDSGEDVEGHRTHQRPLLPEDSGDDDVEGHKVRGTQ